MDNHREGKWDDEEDGSQQRTPLLAESFRVPGLASLRAALSRQGSERSIDSETARERVTLAIKMQRLQISLKQGWDTFIIPPAKGMISTSEAAVRMFLMSFSFGILCFPFAFRKSGLVTGCLTLIAVSLITNYTSKMLVRTKNHLNRMHGVHLNNLQMLVRTKNHLNRMHGVHLNNLKTTPHKSYLNRVHDVSHNLQEMAMCLYGRTGGVLISGFIFFCQLGYAVSHSIYIGITLTALLHHGDSPEWVTAFGHYNAYVVIVIAWGLIFSVLVQIVDEPILAPCVLLATVAMIFAMLLVLAWGVYYHLWLCHSGDHLWEVTHPEYGTCTIYYARWEHLPVFVGMSLFVIIPMNVVLGVEGMMEDPSNFDTALNMSQLGMTTLYMVTGAVGFILFGTNTQSVISLNVPGMWGIFAKLLQTAALTVGYLCVFLPAQHYLEEMVAGPTIAGLAAVGDTLPAMIKKGVDSLTPRIAISEYSQQLFKASCVLGTVIVAVMMPHFGHTLCIFGCLFFAITSFLLPPIFTIQAHGGNVSSGLKVQCAILIFLGVAVMFIGPIFALKDSFAAPIERSVPRHHIAKNASVDVGGFHIMAHPISMAKAQMRAEITRDISAVTAPHPPHPPADASSVSAMHAHHRAASQHMAQQRPAGKGGASHGGGGK